MKYYKQKITELLKLENIILLWSERDLNITGILFENIDYNSVIEYSIDDNLLSNYDKLISFFKANKKIQERNEVIEIGKENKNILIRILSFFSSFLIHKKFKKMKRNFSNYSFNEQEINLMYKISKIAKNNEKLILINNINYANINDIIFFKKLYESNYFNLFAPKVKFILISNSQILFNNNLMKIKKSNIIEVKITENYLNTLCHMLKTKYQTKIPNTDFLPYLKLCNYNVTLVEKILELGFKSIDSLSDENNVDSIKKIVSDILEKIPNLDTLEIASVIGISFDLFFICKMKQIEIPSILNEIKNIEQYGLITEKNKYNYTFINELIRDLVYENSVNNSIWHIKYADSLNVFAPDDFLLISVHYYLGGDFNRSIVYYLSSILFNSIDKKSIQYENKIVTMIEKDINNNIYINNITTEIKDLLKCSIKDLEYYVHTYGYGNDMDAGTQLDKFKHLAKLVVYYVRKIPISENDFLLLGKEFEQIISFLEQYNFTGLKINCYFYLIDIYSYRINKLSYAQKYYHKLLKTLEPLLLSPNSNAQNMRLKTIRKTSSILNPEIAFEKTKNILDSYPENFIDVNEIEIFKFVSDHLGYALYSGNYDEINNEIISLAEKYCCIAEQYNFPKNYKLFMNVFLYKLFNNIATNKDIKNMLSYLKLHKDSTMVRFNYASLLLYTMQLDDAETILNELNEKLKYNNDCFHFHYIKANLVALNILKNNFSIAQTINNEILICNHDWEEEFINIMKYRANCLKKLIKSRKKITSRELFAYLDNDIIVSKTWKFLGKGILFSELMFYRE